MIIAWTRCVLFTLDSCVANYKQARLPLPSHRLRCVYHYIRPDTCFCCTFYAYAAQSLDSCSCEVSAISVLQQLHANRVWVAGPLALTTCSRSTQPTSSNFFASPPSYQVLSGSCLYISSCIFPRNIVSPRLSRRSLGYIRVLSSSGTARIVPDHMFIMRPDY